MILMHRWSNTSSRLRPSTRRGHVSLPYNKIARTVVLYTRPFRLGLMPFWSYKWRRLAKTILAFEIRASISFEILQSVLTQFPRYVKRSTTSRISPWSVKGVFKPSTSWSITLQFDAAKCIPKDGITSVSLSMTDCACSSSSKRSTIWITQIH